MSKLLIENANIILTDKLSRNSAILINNGKISAIYSGGDKLPKNIDEVINANGSYLAPGFIDLHIHGLHNYLIDNGVDALESICKILPQYGVTGFLPTVCPLPKGKDAKFLGALAKVKSSGAQILGFHLEGPFLTLTGALPKEALGKADITRVKNLINAAKPYKAIFSIAPDFEKIEKLIPLMTKKNIPVFITHTKADAKQTLIAIELGACHATHFYDVFYPPADTDPGVRPCGAVEAILANENVSVDFILDGEHVDPITVKMALQCKGTDKVCLITDANIGAGLEPGKYKFGGEEISFAYKGAPARGTKKSRFPGCLYGSGLTMDKAMNNAVKMLDIDIVQAVKMASSNPAKVLGLNNKGKIQRGYDADIVIFDKKLDIVKTFVKGECCYEKI
ncbi:MAG: N-acetylglucosamine-6-phosphate deacetylase [Planctomycetes bacterium GWF2_42_9]|nr:MAG: N-acetylglucosamine-6-phosphate deacetylase [Planctomycetes bacterium GWF2_42_9]